MTPTKMRVGIVLSGGVCAAWRKRLSEALRADGHTVGFIAGPPDHHAPGLELLATLERLVYREPWGAGATSPALSAGPFDLLVGGGEEPTAADAVPTLELLCDGAPFSVGSAAAILDMHAPILEIRLREPNGETRFVAGGRAALEEPHRYLRSRERVEGRIVDLARGVLRRIANGGTAPTVAPVGLSVPPRSAALGFALRVLRDGLVRRLTRLARMEERWRVLWRITAGDDVSERGRWPTFSYKETPDDARRYYADPFVLRHDGRTFVFCEEFPFETQRGIISAFEVREGRAVALPRPVLDPGVHTSYPMVFERDGAVWMIPETCAARRIGLWRAERFPDSWVYAGALVDDVAASDATLHEMDGKLWLLASVADAGGSSWDNLHAWSADRLEGPWTPHPANPLLIDASCARPAGLPFQTAGRWIRPVQDCSRVYGGGLALCAIDKLDESGFEQTVVARLAPPPDFEASRVHTLNAGAGVEVVDVFKAAAAGTL